MDSKKIIIGNWKMNPISSNSAKKNFLEIKKGLTNIKSVDVTVAPPLIYLPELSKSASSLISLGVQNISAEPEGPFTGEISLLMLLDFAPKCAILGHSERRALGETNEFINKKIKLALKNKVTPVLCVGEAEREGGMWHFGKIKTQIEECLVGVTKALAPNIIIAYEPIWAISSTANAVPAQPSDCEEMIIYIQKVLSDMYGMAVTGKIKILYGGSVDEKNARGFMTEGRANGLLLGKSSLTPKKFLEIIKIANNC